MRVSLADGSRSEIASFTLENGVNYFLVGVSGGRFVMKRITADTSAPDPVKTQMCIRDSRKSGGKCTVFHSAPPCF